MRKLLPLLLLILLMPVVALAATKGTFTADEMRFDYDFTSDQQWVLLKWNGRDQDGQQVLYSPDGHFTGSVTMPYAGRGGNLTIEVRHLKGNGLLSQRIRLPQAKSYKAPEGPSNANVRTLTLEETPTGFRYSFTAEGTDFQYLYYLTRQESAMIPIFPVNSDGLYEGEIETPLTYSRAQITVQVVNGQGQMKREGITRKGYQAPPAPEAREGRLSGVVVCIDPGHQEDGVPTREPVGPGLEGYGHGGSGMAQGVATLRKESIVCLEIGMQLRDLLIQEGATVVMTREVNSGSYSNMERCAIANDANAHIMLRLHCDMNGSSTKKGVSVYTPLNSEYAKAVCSKDDYRRLGTILMEELRLAGNYDPTKKTGYVAMTDRFIGSNWAKMLCFLVEMGYMSTPEEDYRLATPTYQRMIAQGMVEGVYKIALDRGWITE